MVCSRSLSDEDRDSLASNTGTILKHSRTQAWALHVAFIGRNYDVRLRGNGSNPLECFNMVELMGGDSVSLNWWPGNRGTALLKQWREKYRRNSDAIDRRERPSPY